MCENESQLQKALVHLEQSLILTVSFYIGTLVQILELEDSEKLDENEAAQPGS